MKELWTYEGDFHVDESMINNGKFIKGKIPDIIYGRFYCDGLNLISLEGGPSRVSDNYYCYDNNLVSLEGCSKNIKYIYTDLYNEGWFVNSGLYINNYFEELLKYIIEEKIDLEEVIWPKGFLTDEIIKSAKGISKFNL